MQILRTLALVGVAVAHTLASPQKLARSELVLVKSVIDGDTITVTTFGRVRLLGIDAPEVSHGLDTEAPFGSEARDRLSRLVWHRWVRLETEGASLDAYNRHLAYVVTEDGQCINTVLVREGLARVSAREPLARLDELKRAEAEAQRFRKGIWGTAPPASSTGYTRRSGATRSSAPKTSQPKKGTRKKKSP
jgi:endonuclease YncB( thermonuclease family)